MPTATIVGILSGISAGLLVIGGSAIVLTLGLAGLCTMFSWLDMHIGGFKCGRGGCGGGDSGLAEGRSRQ